MKQDLNVIEMVRQRKRYTVCEISYPGGANKRFAISQEMIVTVVLQAVSLRKGEVGYARVKPSLRCVYCNQVTGIVVLMCHRDDMDILESSLSAVTNFGSNCQARCKHLHSSHTAKQVYKFIAKYQRDTLLKQRQASKNEAERRQIMERVRELNEKLMEIAQRSFDFDTLIK
ncbi:ribonuclease P/MRP protein subunit POP5-like [Convolutriloba macropyga]|uniref:ribonuclease P/MRP protein subunit POP5-like n=1 Tax=Convolutriloba macropyga TaxID=536237 RepID=UPI003F522D8B